MEIQGKILLTYGALVVLTLAVFVVVAASSRGAPEPYADVQPRGYRVRRVWFWSLLAVLVVAFGVWGRLTPYSKAEAAPDAISFPIVARQYAFENMPEVVPYGVPVVFKLTSIDVNHGFAIYDTQDRIVGQVQAMPGYANDLHVTFTEKGKYIVRCLEFCGINHAFMQGSFEVK
ncbi:MAG: hypothetical protein KF875_12090 [Trueperaceae bacterium]|nr:hypothetical protein [Trueperaceae bacterium]MCW5818491.1 hypothetical protein [Trueperaceae bacterium]